MEEKNHKILIVDDDDAFRLLLTEAFRKVGCNIIDTGDASEAFSMALREKPDMILLDTLMPQKSGPEVLSDLRVDDATKEIPVVMITQVGSIDNVANTLQEGIEGYIIKNELSIEEIVDRVMAIIERLRTSGKNKSQEENNEA